MRHIIISVKVRLYVTHIYRKMHGWWRYCIRVLLSSFSDSKYAAWRIHKALRRVEDENLLGRFTVISIYEQVEMFLLIIGQPVENFLCRCLLTFLESSLSQCTMHLLLIYEGDEIKVPSFEGTTSKILKNMKYYQWFKDCMGPLTEHTSLPWFQKKSFSIGPDVRKVHRTSWQLIRLTCDWRVYGLDRRALSTTFEYSRWLQWAEYKPPTPTASCKFLVLHMSIHFPNGFSLTWIKAFVLADNTISLVLATRIHEDTLFLTNFAEIIFRTIGVGVGPE